jgi:hypothetical protein
LILQLTKSKVGARILSCPILIFPGFSPHELSLHAVDSAVKMKETQNTSPGAKARVIRQAISCDICGTEMQNPNHWFVVFDRGAEFRMSRWNSRTRLRPDARHLCGQTCLHKLVDEYMARTIADRAPASAEEPQSEKKAPQLTTRKIDASLTSNAAHAATPAPAGNQLADVPAHNTRTWEAAAWKREREREQRAALRPFNCR